MNITKEDFNKLKTLDRIEYRQKADYIQRLFCFGLGDILWYLFIIWSIFVIGFLIIYETSGRVNDLLLSLSGTTFNFIIFILTFSIFNIIIGSFIRRQKFRELNEEYFNFKTEVKKK